MDFLIKLFSDILSDVITGQVESTSGRLTHQVWWRIPIYRRIRLSAPALRHGGESRVTR